MTFEEFLKEVNANKSNDYLEAVEEDGLALRHVKESKHLKYTNF